MNTQQALEKVRHGLVRLRFRQFGHDHWELPVKSGMLTVTMLASGNPYYRGEWTDGRYRDVVFFEFGLTEKMDMTAPEELLTWAAWYIAGNRLTERGTVGYVQAEAQAA